MENHGAILIADVAELPVLHSRIDVMPEILQRLFVGDFGGIVDPAHRLGVARAAGTHLFVGRILRLAAGVARFGRDQGLGVWGQGKAKKRDAPRLIPSPSPLFIDLFNQPLQSFDQALHDPPRILGPQVFDRGVLSRRGVYSSRRDVFILLQDMAQRRHELRVINSHRVAGTGAFFRLGPDEGRDMLEYRPRARHLESFGITATRCSSRSRITRS